ncbi:DNA gyrase subunit A [Candidatus Shapirobacteria bacterium CG_4_8_14_3_um_filter_39_11]|uniref:DNA gyrase subunit A n=1 Tax=Candidatus Shapirobacteria bacterium CG_4_8_14_3_um_filter_39_11 TaxID=1974875 RepID=A0A2M8GH87_9BACT|nr:MAG: DNA gyrase subunit A [Candidatus Shapirobacteria bacterium CG_4_8_14_3_um_filter_39_11]
MDKQEIIETPKDNIGKLVVHEISDVMKKSYLDYAMSVIVQRALPDVKDGLKPVHRRILYAMHEMGLSHTSKFTKSAKVVGEVMGKFHPHGDMPIYQALVRMAQEFSMRYPLITGQGNFGSMDGDPPAAMRYTEVKLAAISAEMLSDIEKDTIDYIDNFDQTLKDPLFLPARVPNLLLMGAEGIAVGMATKIPPHNLNEVVEATMAMIEKGKMGDNLETAAEKELEFKRIVLEEGSEEKTEEKLRFESDITIDEITGLIKGPDFPTAGAIYNTAEIKEAYQTGRGRVLIRGKAEIEETKSGKYQIVISEIPYQVNKAQLVVKIANLVKDKKIDGISDLRDESDREGIRVVVELKKDAKPKSVLNNLFKKTELQTTFPVNIVALVNGTPMTLNVKQVLIEYVDHRYSVVRRRSLFELAAAKERGHILEGLLIALDHLDEVINTIRASKDADTAKINLMEKFGLTERQAVAILDMQLRKLAALERKKIEDEYKSVQETIAFLTDLISHPEKILKIISNELSEIKAKYGDERRTKVYKGKVEEFSEEDLISNEETLIIVTQTGYIKRAPRGTYKTQKRGGKGVMGMSTKEEDEISHLLSANTHDAIMFFTNKGRVFRLRVWDLPEGSRQSKGQAIINLINIEQGETLQSILTIGKQQIENEKQNLIMVTKKGTVKKTPLSKFENVRSSGLIAINLSADDELCWAKITSGDDHILLVSHDGKSIKFSEKDVRQTGRDTQGVRGILLKKEDFVVGMEIAPNKLQEPKDKRKKIFKDILVVMENGVGKRTNITEFPLQKRGGMGVKVAEVTPKTGKVICSQAVDEEVEQVVLTSKQAQVIKLPLKNIPRLGRATQGVILMRLDKSSSDGVSAVACLRKETSEETP